MSSEADNLLVDPSSDSHPAGLIKCRVKPGYFVHDGATPLGEGSLVYLSEKFLKLFPDHAERV